MSKIASLIRLSRWRLDEKRRALSDLEALAGHLHRQSQALADEVRHEQQFAAASGEPQPSLGPYISATLERQAHLTQSIAEVEQRITLARDDIAAAYQEVKRYELAEAERRNRDALLRQRRETSAFDEIGAVRFERSRRSTVEG